MRATIRSRGAAGASSGGGNNHHAALLVSGDRIKLLLLAGFVLLVFWGGVAVGVGFSHGHEDTNTLPGGVLISRRTRAPLAEDAMPMQQQQHEQPALRGSSSSSSTTTTAISAQLAKMRACVETPSSCSGDLLPPVGARFTGDGNVRFEVVEEDEDVQGLDLAPATTLSAWVLLEKGSLDDAQIKTVVANRFSGCDHGPQYHGYSLFINRWNTDDRTVNLMWFEEAAPCATLSTPIDVITYGRWHHIVAELFTSSGGTGGTEARIYVDGQLKASVSSPGKRITRDSQKKNAFTIGAHPGGDRHPFFGKISTVAVQAGEHALDTTKLFPQTRYGASDLPAVRAFFSNLKGEGADVIANESPASKLHLKRTATWTRSQIQTDFSFLVPVGSVEDMANGLWPRATFFASADLKEQSDALARERREWVRNAMKHAYGSYEKYAFGFDEVTPKSGSPRNNWGGMAVTMIDALDTLWIMGLKDEFFRARDYCRDRMRFDHVGSVSVFETTIRVLGGLMSAYDLSGDAAFLDRAVELGTRLLGAFNTPSGLPGASVSLAHGGGGGSGGGQSNIAEVGTLQLEFRALAYHSNKRHFAEKVEVVHKQMRKSPPPDGLWPMYVSTQTGQSVGGVVTFGAMGDSFFEYLLKLYVQGGMTEPEYLADYERAMDGLHRHVLQRSRPNKLMYLADYTPGGYLNHKMDHLACFVPGLLALGVYKRGNSEEHRAKNERDLITAKGLMYTCVQFYERQPTGISPEWIQFGEGADDFVVPSRDPFYILRPETVESLFLLHTVTGHPVYRDWGHKIMLSIEKYCKTERGYGNLPDVRATNRQPDDRMESFFLAETLKYLFLLQDPDSEINLDKFVFNTEAHPLKILPPGWRTRLGLD